MQGGALGARPPPPHLKKSFTQKQQNLNEKDKGKKKKRVKGKA